MRKFFKIIIPIVLVVFTADWFYGYFLQQNQNLKLSFVPHLKNVEVLVHGPCEPLFTINPSILEKHTGLKSYNLALRHTDFADNYLHLYLYLKANQRPQKVLLYVTPESFDTRFNAFHTYNFTPYLDDPEVAAIVKHQDPNYAPYMHIPLLRYTYFGRHTTFNALQGFNHWIQGKQAGYFESGFEAHDSTAFALQPDGYIAPKHLMFSGGKTVTTQSDSSLYYELYTERQTFNWDQNRALYLERIIKLCASAGIELILYESTPYKGAIADQPNRTLFLERIDSMAKVHHIPFWLMENHPIGLHKSNFVCPLILTESASEEFTKALADSIK